MEFKVAVNVIFKKDGCVLLGKRIGRVGYGLWCVPGGKLEPGESLLGGARREAEEETGVKVDGLIFSSIINDPEGGTHWIHVNFVAGNLDPRPVVTEPEKFEKWEFFSPDQLPECFGPHKKIIELFFQGQKYSEMDMAGR